MVVGTYIPIQIMLLLTYAVYISLYEARLEGHLTYLVVAPESSITTYREHPYILLLDCTYKINRFNVPLFNFVRMRPHRT